MRAYTGGTCSTVLRAFAKTGTDRALIWNLDKIFHVHGVIQAVQLHALFDFEKPLAIRRQHKKEQFQKEPALFSCVCGDPATPAVTETEVEQDKSYKNLLWIFTRQVAVHGAGRNFALTHGRNNRGSAGDDITTGKDAWF